MKRIGAWQGWAALAAVLMLAAACWMSPKIKEKFVSDAVANPPMHTLCVGRYLIDVPANYELEHYGYRIDGVEISWIYKAKDRVSFDAVLNDRKAELAAELNDYDKPSLEEPEEYSVNGMHVVILPYGRINLKYLGAAAGMTEGGRYLEAWVWTGRRGYKFDGKNLGPGAREQTLLSRIELLKELDANVIPTEPGFCMEMFNARAMIAGLPAGKSTSEGVMIQFGVKDHSDVKFMLNFVPNGDKLSESLFERHARVMDDSRGYADRISSLRQRRAVVRGMDGEELVQAFREENGTRGLSFDWEWLGRANDPYAPYIALEAKTGWSNDGPVQSGLSDEEALRLWDSVVDSIRVRPGSDVKTGQTAPKRPLGQLATTGRVCEQAGLWECDEPRAIDGHRRRFIQVGEVMPGTFVRTEPKFWDRIKGTAPAATRVATLWKLIDYDAPATNLASAQGSDLPPLRGEQEGDGGGGAEG